LGKKRKKKYAQNIRSTVHRTGDLIKHRLTYAHKHTEYTIISLAYTIAHCT